MSLKQCDWCGEMHDEGRTCSRPPWGMTIPTPAERLALRVSYACLVLEGIEAKLVVEAVAAQMPGAHVFWDEDKREVEIIGPKFEVVVRMRGEKKA